MNDEASDTAAFYSETDPLGMGSRLLDLLKRAILLGVVPIMRKTVRPTTMTLLAEMLPLQSAHIQFQPIILLKSMESNIGCKSPTVPIL